MSLIIPVFTPFSGLSVFIGVPRNDLEALDLSTGKYRWRGVTPYRPLDDVIYNPAEKELIASGAVIIDPGSGKILRSFEPSFIAYPPTDNEARGRMYAVDRNHLFVRGKVRHAQTGEVIADIGRVIFTPPVIIDDTIYISNSVDGVIATDRETFKMKWQYQPSSKILSTPMVSKSPVVILDGVGYVIFEDVTLRAFDPETGQELGYWQPSRLRLLQQATCFPVRPDCMRLNIAGLTTSEDTLFVSLGDGKLYAFGK